MNDFSTILLQELNCGKQNKASHKLDFSLVLPDCSMGEHTYNFLYDYASVEPFSLFLQMRGEPQSVVLRLGNALGDRKSYDMFHFFNNTKSAAMKNTWSPRVGYRKGMFSSEFDNFQGFWPFGFTLIQPTANELLLGHFHYRAFPPSESCVLELSIYNYRFTSIAIYNDLVTREVLSERAFDEADLSNY